MPRLAVLAASRKELKPEVKLTSTVYGLMTVVPAYGPRSVRAYWDFVAGLKIRSKLYFTAAALNGVPSEKVTPWRRLKV